MIDTDRIREGMTVYSADGHELGKVIACDANTFIIEKGFFFTRDYVARYEDVFGVWGDDVRLSRRRDELGEAGFHRREGAYSEGSSVMGPGGGIETQSTAIGLEGDHGEHALERRAAPPDLEEGPAQLGEDPGTLGPTREEPDE
jgi:hypothetical protein